MNKKTATNFIAKNNNHAIPILALTRNEFTSWVKKQSSKDQLWLKHNDFTAKPTSMALLPDANGAIKLVLLGLAEGDVFDFWAFGALPAKLPGDVYEIANDYNMEQLEKAALGWLLGCYSFDRYKTGANKKIEAELFLPETFKVQKLANLVEPLFWARDLINAPAQDMDPNILATEAKKLAASYKAKFKQTIGKDLLKKKLNAIYAVGKGSIKEPRLVDISWGAANLPLVTLVGKGVCFDSGGLDIKSAAGMLDMKGDMAGAACALALARMIMQAKLPVRLRVLLPIVENLVSGTSYKPGDIIRGLSGKTIEINNTDAEGRVILSDALTLASQDKPDLLFTFATLTGAARVALGTDIPALFTENESVSSELLAIAKDEQDPIWRLPLYAPYRELLDSKIADISNVSKSSYGGAITAALFLKEFVAPKLDWIYFDLADNSYKNKAGTQSGGEATGMRAVFAYLVKRYSKKRK